MEAISDDDFDKSIIEGTKVLQDNNPYAEIEKRYQLLPNFLQNLQLNGERSGQNDVSPKGTKGSFQMMPENIRAYRIDPSNNNQSAEAAAKLLSEARLKYQKDFPNASEEEINRALIAHYNSGWRGGKAVLSGNEIPFKETRDYLARTAESPLLQIQTISDSVFDQSLGLSSDNQPISDDEFDQSLSGLSVREANYRKKVSHDQLDNRAQEYTHEQFIPESAPIVMAQKAVQAISGGIIKPEWVSEEEINQSPKADIAGQLLGTAPYFFLPGGLPVQSAALAARAGSEAYNDDKDKEQILAHMALEGAAPVIGKYIGSGIALTGKGFGKAVQAISSRTSSATERANIKAGKLILEDLESSPTVSSNVQNIIKSGLPEGFSDDVTKFSIKAKKCSLQI